MIENKFLIIMPVYNSAAFVEKSIRSILNQSYQNFTLAVMDDCSTDETTEIINSIDGRFNHYVNDKRVGSPLYSFVRGISFHTDNKDDILITVDGDDWLYDNGVLEYMNEVYQDPDVWLTYGSFITESGNLDNYCRPVTDTRSYRKGQWVTGHLRTLRHRLFDHINQKDFIYKDGVFYNKYNDTAYMYPAVELAGLKHIKFIDKILYVYNDKNPLCSIFDFANAHLNADWDQGESIRNKPQYKELAEL